MRHIPSCLLLAFAAALFFSTPAQAARVIHTGTASVAADELSGTPTGVAPSSCCARLEAPPAEKIVETDAMAPSGDIVVQGTLLGSFKTTGYSNPDGNASADGSMPRAGHTVATDWSVIPRGSKLRFGGSNLIYTVEDTGVHGAVVDVYYGSNAEASAHGVQYQDVYLIR